MANSDLVHDNDISGVRSIAKACALLDCLGQAADGMTLTQVTDALGVPYSTAHRLLNSLIACNYIQRAPDTKRYFLGLHILELQANIAKRFRLIEIVIPHMTRLIQEIAVTSHLAVLHDADIIYLESRRSSEDPFFQMYTPPGRSVPAHCTALGKALLAYLPADTLTQTLSEKPLLALTPNTVVDLEVLQQRLADVRRRGYSFDLEEFALGVHCVAAPIRSRSGDVIAALSISGRKEQISLARIDELGSRVVAECAQISRKLGYAAP
jgi:IclR family KDG regulon transcriptional repressor